MKKFFLILVVLFLVFSQKLLYSQIPTNGLIAYYPFNGNANDESGNGKHGTIYGATLSSDAFGNPNSAYSFDGNSNYIRLPKIFDERNNSFTFSVWIKPLYKNNGYLFGQFNNISGDNHHVINIQEQINGNKYVYQYFDFPGSNEPKKPIYSKSEIQLETWVHLVITKNGNISKIYINGILDKEETNTIEYTGNEKMDYSILGCRFHFGNIFESDSYSYKGLMDEVRFYDRPLNEDEIKLLNLYSFEFDYPFGDKGIDKQNKKYEILEFISGTDEKNFIYPDNPKFIKSGAKCGQSKSGWYNFQDVGCYLGVYGGRYYCGIHPGEDWNKSSDEGEPIFSIANGKVVKLKSVGSSNNHIVIEHLLLNNKKIFSIYYHIDPLNSIKINDFVSIGQQIGNIHNWEVPHLHFELRYFQHSMPSNFPKEDLWPNDNGRGYYTDTKDERCHGMNENEVINTFENMKKDGIIDPSDFIDNNRYFTKEISIVEPQIGKPIVVDVKKLNSFNMIINVFNQGNEQIDYLSKSAFIIKINNQECKIKDFKKDNKSYVLEIIPPSQELGLKDINISVNYYLIKELKGAILYTNTPLIEKGLAWLRSQQQNDGSWYSDRGFHVGYTAFALQAFLAAGYGPDDITVKNGIKYLKTKVHNNGLGGIYSDWGVSQYETSIATTTLKSYLKYNSDNEIETFKNNAQKALIQANKINHYGGWRYTLNSTDVDMSNMQWAILALDDINDDELWSRVRNCLHTYMRHPDGHYYYAPYWDEWPYQIPSTAAAIWGEIISKGPQEYVDAAFNWYQRAFGNAQNIINAYDNHRPYYYLYNLSKACALNGKTLLAGENWYKILYNKLDSWKRADDGSKCYWPNYGGDQDDRLATMLAILSLQTGTVPPNSKFVVKVDGINQIAGKNSDLPQNGNCLTLKIYDPEGRYAGQDDNGDWVTFIPNSKWVDVPGEPLPKFEVIIYEATNFKIEVHNTCQVQYSYTIDFAAYLPDNPNPASHVVYNDVIPGKKVRGTTATITSIGGLTVYAPQPIGLPQMAVTPVEVVYDRIKNNNVYNFNINIAETGCDADLQNIDIFATDLVDEYGNNIPASSFVISPQNYTNIPACSSKNVNCILTIPGSSNLNLTSAGSFKGNIVVQALNQTKSVNITLNTLIYRFNYVVETGRLDICPFDYVYFTADTDSYVLQYTWDFGDGSPQKYGRYVSHIFTVNGNYTVKLIVLTKDGRITEFSRVLSVNSFGCPLTIRLDNESACFGNSLVLGPDPLIRNDNVYQLTVRGGSGDYQIDWYPNSGLDYANTPNPVLKNVYKSGTFTINVLDRQTNEFKSATMAVIAVDLPLVVVKPNNITIKKGSTGNLGNCISVYNGQPPYDYYWCDKLGWSSSSSNPSIKFDNIGSYRYFVTVTDANGCKSVEKSILVKVQNTGQNGFIVTFEPDEDLSDVIDDNLAKKTIFIYPNPTNDLFNLEMRFDKKINTDIKLYSLIGESIQEAKYFDVDYIKHQFDLTSFAPGIYFVRIYINGEVFLEKIIKE